MDQKSVADHAEALVRALSTRAERLLNALEAKLEDPAMAKRPLGLLSSMMASVLAVSLSRVQAQVREFGIPSFSEVRARNLPPAPPPPRIAPGGAWVHAVPRGGGNRGGAGHAQGGDAEGEGIGLPGEAGAEAGRLGAEAGRAGKSMGWAGWAANTAADKAPGRLANARARR